MTQEEALYHLISGADPKDPKTWEAYRLVYGKYHPLDPKFDDGGANDDRIYKTTPQKFDPQEWPKAEFEDDPLGEDTLLGSPYALNPTHFATEETTEMLASRVGGIPVFLEGASEGPFRLPGWWHLDFGIENVYPNAGRVGVYWNKAIDAFKRNIDNWNLNLGANNPITDPQTNTPAQMVQRRLDAELSPRRPAPEPVPPPTPEPEPYEDPVEPVSPFRGPSSLPDDPEDDE